MSDEEIAPQNAFDDDEDDEDGFERSGNLNDGVKEISTTHDRKENAKRIPNRPNWSSSGSIGNIDLKDEVVSGGRKMPGTHNGDKEEDAKDGRKGLNGGGTRFGSGTHIPVAGRRAGLRTKPDDESGRPSNDASEENLFNNEDRPATLNRSGWGLADDDATAGVSNKKAGRQKNDLEQAGPTIKKASYTVLNDNPDEVTVVIPDLADVVDEDMTAQVAAAPSNKMNRILALRELDKELEAGSSLMINEAPNGIDLSLLIATLNHPDQLMEDDRHWDWSIVFNQVASDIQLDIEANEIAVCKNPSADKSEIKSQ